MKKLLIFSLLILSACASADNSKAEQAERKRVETNCRGMGLKSGTQDFAKCVEHESGSR